MTEITVKDVITPVKICLSVDSTVKDAVDALVKSGQQSACVCSQSGKIVGIFTEKEGLKAYTNSIYFSEGTGNLRDIMTKDIVSVEPDALLTKIALIFVENDFHQIPVLKDGQLEGEIKRGHLLSALARHIPARESETSEQAAQVVGKFEGKQPEVTGSALPHGLSGAVDEKEEQSTK